VIIKSDLDTDVTFASAWEHDMVLSLNLDYSNMCYMVHTQIYIRNIIKHTSKRLGRESIRVIEY